MRESVQMENGIKNGSYKAYYEDGTLWKDSHFSSDALQGEMSIYYPTGELMIVRQFANNFIQGKQLRYWKSGKLNEVSNFNKGKLNGNYFFVDSLKSDTLIFANYFEEKIRYQKILDDNYEVVKHYMHYEISFDTLNVNHPVVCFKVFPPTSINLFLEIGNFSDGFRESGDFELEEVTYEGKASGKEICFDLKDYESPYLRGHLSEYNKEGFIIGTVIVDLNLDQF
ncbi:MAG: hypothetical protein HRT61_23790 [Ekhidna sp.]|nr:hypothetical protein [Ekhidna sp.]